MVETPGYCGSQIASAKSSAREDLVELVAGCADDLGQFHDAVLGRPPLTLHQERIAASITRNRWTICPTAHAQGKTWLAPSLVLGWLYTRPGSIVLTTSPSNNQLVHALWGGIKAAHRRSRFPLAGRLSEGSATPQLLRLDDRWFAIGFSAGKVESFQGIRPDGGECLVVVDEASGVDDAIWAAIESLGATSHLVLGNPIRARCHFRTLYDLAVAGVPGYAAVRLTAFDSPYASMTDTEIAAAGLPRGLASRDWIDGVRRTYGEGSLYWRTRVLAMFPDEDHDQLLPAAWLDRCRLVARAAGHAPAQLALDLSKGSGRDRTVAMVGDLLGLREVIEDSTISLHSAANLAALLCGRHGVRHELVVYDAGGWAGSDFRRYLDAVGLREAVGYRGGDAGGGEFANARARAGWRLRQRLDPDRPSWCAPRPVDRSPVPTATRNPALAPPPPAQPPWHVPGSIACWDQLRAELAELRYRHDGPKIRLERKEDLQLRLGHSPDLADTALMLASRWDFDG
jgi:hypothetical protein